MMLVQVLLSALRNLFIKSMKIGARNAARKMIVLRSTSFYLIFFSWDMYVSYLLTKM
jgi:hypothetical protein